MIAFTPLRLAMRAVVAGLLLLPTYPGQAAQTLGPVTDDIGVIKIPKGAPIQIGGYWVLSGPDTAQGIDGRRGVEVAIADIGGKLLGHPIKFSVEDDLCTAEGGQTAATKLAANRQLLVVLGGRLFQRRDAGRAHSVAGGDRQYLHRLLRALAHRAGSQAVL